MSEQCPIGMDHDPDACMAGVCRRCKVREAKQLFWQGFRRGITAPWSIVTDYWPRSERGRDRLLWVVMVLCFCLGAYLTWISLP